MSEDKKSLIEHVGEAIYGIRWGLVPMYLGLWVAIIAYNLWFFRLEFTFLIHLQDATATSFLLWMLNLIDITMVANLVVMTTVGGYSTFVREFNLRRLEGKPRWMNKLDSSQLKIKTSMSLVTVTGIHLLQSFMEADHIDTKAIVIEGSIHLIFMLTMLAFTWNARLMPHHQDTTNETPHH